MVGRSENGQGGEATLLVERLALPEDGAYVALLTLNNPANLNPLDWDTFRLLETALRAADAAPEVRTVLVTGAGRAFSAGGDLKAYQTLQRDPVEFPRFLEDAHRTFSFIREMSTPLVSLVNGVTAAGGLELALFSDWAYAAAGAKIGDSHLTFGMMGGGGVLALLPRTIPPARARELVLTGRMLTAEEALEWGIVTRVVPPGELVDAGVAVASEIARKSPLAVALAKHVMNGVTSDGSSLDAGLRYERQLALRYCLTSEDAQEGLRAFAEKRTPNFAGR